MRPQDERFDWLDRMNNRGITLKDPLVTIVWLAVFSALCWFCMTATAADPVVGKPIAYPPAWLAGLEDIPGPLSALPNAPFPLPQQNTQRFPVSDLVRLCAPDGGHAPIVDPYRRILLGVCATNLTETVAYANGGLLFGAAVPAGAAGYLVISENSTAQGAVRGWGRTDVCGKFVRDGVKAAWVDPVTPVLNILPIGSADQANGIASGKLPVPDVIDEAISVLGWSTSSAPYQVHAVNCVAAMPSRVFAGLKAQGKLCQAVADCLSLGVTDATGRKKLGKLYPRIDDLSLEQHIAVAAAVARRANKYEAVPLISDFDRWFNANGAGLDRASAKAGWDARGNQ